MALWADRLLLLYAFTAPWFFGLVTLGDNRLAITDILLVPCVALILFLWSRTQWRMMHTFVLSYGLCALASILPLVDHVLFPVLALKTMRLLGILAPCLLAGLLPVSPERLSRLVKGFYIGGLISILYGIVAFEFQWEAGTAMQMHYYDGNRYLRRAGGVFQDSTAFGHLLATWAILALFVPLISRSLHGLKLLAFWALTLTVAAVGLYTSLSRTAMLHLLVAGFSLVLLPRVKSWSPFRLLLVPALIAIVLLSFHSLETIRPGTATAGSITLERFLSFVRSGMEGGSEALDVSGGRRITTWIRAFYLWEEQPFLGVGYKTLIPLYGMCSDNTLVVALCETGLFGFILFSGVMLGFMWSAWKSYAQHWPGGRAYVVLWAGQFIHALTADTVTFVGSMSIVLAMSMSLMQYQRKTEKARPRRLALVPLREPAWIRPKARAAGVSQ